MLYTAWPNFVIVSILSELSKQHGLMRFLLPVIFVMPEMMFRIRSTLAVSRFDWRCYSSFTPVGPLPQASKARFASAKLPPQAGTAMYPFPSLHARERKKDLRLPCDRVH
eukprot:1152286-Pelagomonas_calceolata.AAC.1